MNLLLFYIYIINNISYMGNAFSQPTKKPSLNPDYPSLEFKQDQC